MAFVQTNYLVTQLGDNILPGNLADEFDLWAESLPGDEHAQLIEAKNTWVSLLDSEVNLAHLTITNNYSIYTWASREACDNFQGSLTENQLAILFSTFLFRFLDEKQLTLTTEETTT